MTLGASTLGATRVGVCKSEHPKNIRVNSVINGSLSTHAIYQLYKP